MANDDSRPPHVVVADAIRDAVDAGLLVPGDFLPSRPEMAREHGVPVGTIGQALRILIDEGILAARQPQGFYVRDAPAATQRTIRRLLVEASDLLAELEPKAKPETRLAIKSWRQRAQRAGSER
jgi:DNA-binding GntR family transcriptional regulator